MKELILLMVAFAAVATANAEELDSILVNKNAANVEVGVLDESTTYNIETYDKNSWGAKLQHSPFSLGLSLQTKYVWRGSEMQTEDASPTFFPSIGYSYKGLYVYVMGGYNFNGKYAEVDYGVSYTWKCLTFGVNDYYYPTTNAAEDDYFNYKGRSTGHWLEAVMTIAPEKIPTSLTISNFFAGADKKNNGKQAYSTYAELCTWYDFLNNHRISATCGVAVNKSCYNGYKHNFGVCNIETKYTYNFVFKNGRSLPLSCSYILNPVFRKSYVNFTASLTL